MLVLTRKKRQKVVVGDSGGRESPLVITALEISGGRVRIGFTTALTVPIGWGEMLIRP
jgi:sRNA-binding carbon storage regulator CsrA